MATPEFLVALAFAALIALALALWPLRAFLRAGGGGRRIALSLAVCAAVASTALYAAIGKPNVAGGSHSARVAALEARLMSNPGAALAPDEAIAVWRDVARRAPQDPTPLMYVGSLLMRKGDARGAAAAFDAALRRDRENPAIMVELAIAMASAEGGVGPDSLALFEAASARAPEDPRPLLYQAMAAMEGGREADARALWARVGRLLPPDDPRQEMVRAMTAKSP